MVVETYRSLTERSLDQVELDLMITVVQQEQLGPIRVHDQVGRGSKPGDVEGIGMFWGYWFGFDTDDGRIETRFPEKPRIPIVITHAIRMNKYPARKRLEISPPSRRCIVLPALTHLARPAMRRTVCR